MSVPSAPTGAGDGRPTGFAACPPEVLTQIASSLDLSDRVSASAATRRLYAAVADSRLQLGPIKISQGSTGKGDFTSLYLVNLLTRGSPRDDDPSECLFSAAAADAYTRLLGRLFSRAHAPSLVLTVNFAPPQPDSLRRLLRLMAEGRLSCGKLTLHLEPANYHEQLFDFLNEWPSPPDCITLFLLPDTPLHMEKLCTLRPLRMLMITNQPFPTPHMIIASARGLGEDLVLLVERHENVLLEGAFALMSDETVERLAEVVVRTGHRLRVRVRESATDAVLASRGFDRTERGIFRRSTGEQIYFPRLHDSGMMTHREWIGEGGGACLDFGVTSTEMFVDIHNQPTPPTAAD